MRTIEEINAKIRQGRAVVVTAEEIIDIVEERGVPAAAREVDVVTTGTFSPMCSSGAFLNVKQPTPKMKLGGGHATLNGVPAYTGLAAADIYLGANALPYDDPRNSKHPGHFRYGGAHVIEELVAGKAVTLEASGYGTDCYPKRRRTETLTLADLNNAVLYNPRNCYQNYNVGVNLSDKPIYTYMGKLKPRLGNAYYCSAGQLSPLMNDPCLRTIGIGSRIFLAGAQGYVAWHGTQHNPGAERHPNGVPRSPAATLALVGDLTAMQPRWLRAVSFAGYGVSLSVGVGVPIPILDEEMLRYTAVTDADITAPVVDYSEFYPTGKGEARLAEVTYAQLRSGAIEVRGQTIPTGCFSSYAGAREVAARLKEWIATGAFTLTAPVALLPGARGGEEVPA